MSREEILCPCCGVVYQVILVAVNCRYIDLGQWYCPFCGYLNHLFPLDQDKEAR